MLHSMSTSTDFGHMENLRCEDVIVDYDYSEEENFFLPDAREHGKKLHFTSLNRKS